MSGPTDPATRDVGLFSGNVRIAAEGDPRAPACLLVHGAPGTVRDFRYLAPAIAAQGLYAVRVGMPGFGETPRRTWPRVDAAGRAGFLAQVASALGLVRYAVVGHSIGGPAALLSAALFPNQVSALVLINSVGLLRHRGLSAPEDLSRLLGLALKSPWLAPRVVPRLQQAYRRLGFRDVEALDVAALSLHLDLIAGLDFQLHRWAARTVRCPVLVASSEDDPLVGPRVSFHLAGAFSPPAIVRHLHFAGGGHYLQKHEAPRLARHLAEMLAAEEMPALVVAPRAPASISG